VGEQLAEFVTLMWFDSLADVQAFAGADYEVAVVPPAARWNKERGVGVGCTGAGRDSLTEAHRSAA
jgi:hypothetical protein